MPTEPPPCHWLFPDLTGVDDDGLLATGADLEPGTLLAAYRSGLFPMPVGRRGRIGWWSPEPRGVIPLDGLRVSRSLRASCRRYEVRVDSCFSEVVRCCADSRRPGGWITVEMRAAYERLHALGWTHSVETWSRDGRLVGGLYGVAIGGLFAGESMFTRERDASKVALVALRDVLCTGAHGVRLLDVQWVTRHLRSLGAVPVSRSEYLRLLVEALRSDLPPVFDEPEVQTLRRTT